MSGLTILPLTGIPPVEPGDDLAALIFAALERQSLRLADRDVLAICQKAVSKAEGRLVDLRTVTPSPEAQAFAATARDKDPRAVEVILRESTRIVRRDAGRLIVETGPGWVCANAGVDESNSGDPNRVVLLPLDPDTSAQQIVDSAAARFACRIAVLVTDTFGRPWREGLVDFALGVAGMSALLDLRGSRDLDGRELHHTIMAQADALAAAAGLVMKKGAGIPAALIRGHEFEPGPGSGKQLIRSPETDLFR